MWTCPGPFSLRHVVNCQLQPSRPSHPESCRQLAVHNAAHPNEGNPLTIHRTAKHTSLSGARQRLTELGFEYVDCDEGSNGYIEFFAHPDGRKAEVLALYTSQVIEKSCAPYTSQVIEKS